ncbi:MAG: cupin domain-containing protein [Rhodobacteraceae bacterium]|nr:cupin domain-containing protein [Paracoccaceae bacterium]
MLPDFIKALPALDIPVGPDVVSTHALNSDKGLGVFFVFHQDFAIPPHAHKAQWGTVLAGALTLTLEGETRTYRTGESYTIPSGAEHSASGTAGTIAFDVFEEPDRYRLRG